MNVIFNHDENRIRAGGRIVAQLLLMFMIALGLILILSQFVDTSGNVLTTLATAVGAVSSMYLAARSLDVRPWSNYGLIFNQQAARECLWGVALAALAMGIIFLVEYAAGWVTVTGWGWQHHRPDESFIIWLGGYLFFMIIVSFWEELVFRGYQIVNLSEGFNFPGFTPRQAVMAAVLLSSIVFGVMHALNPNAGILSTLNITLAGAMLAFPFVITGRLALSIGLHIGWNFFQGGIFGFPVSGVRARNSLAQIDQAGPAWLTGGSFGPEAGLLGLAGLTIIIGGLVWYLKFIDESLDIRKELAAYPSNQHKIPEQSL